MKPETRNKLFARLPVIIYFGIIFYESSHPLPKGFPSKLYFDKICHFFAYLVAGVLALRAARTISCLKSPALSVTVSIATVVLYGIIDEIHQSFTPMRQSDPFDLLADILGCITGVLVYNHVFRVKNNKGLVNRR